MPSTAWISGRVLAEFHRVSTGCRALSDWLLVGNGGMGFGDYYRGPYGTIIGIHSPIPYYEPGSYKRRQQCFRGSILRLMVDVPEPYTIPCVLWSKSSACNKSPLNRALQWLLCRPCFEECSDVCKCTSEGVDTSGSGRAAKLALGSDCSLRTRKGLRVDVGCPSADVAVDGQTAKP